MTDRSREIRTLIDGPAGTAELLPLVYEELKELARARLARLPQGHTLQATALVHEAYLRTSGRQPLGWEDQRHFFLVAARAMRDVLVDHWRRKSARKRGGDLDRITLSGLADTSLPPDATELLALDEALLEFERTHPDHYPVVMLRFFGGKSTEEIAELLDTSTRTVKRRWRFARAVLLRAIEGDSRGR